MNVFFVASTYIQAYARGVGIKQHKGEIMSKVVGIRLNENILDLAESLRETVGKNIERYPAGLPSRAQVLREALIRGLKDIKTEE